MFARWIVLCSNNHPHSTHMHHSSGTLGAVRLCSHCARCIELSSTRIARFSIYMCTLHRRPDYTYWECRHKYRRCISWSNHSPRSKSNYTAVCINRLIAHRYYRHKGTAENIHSQMIVGCKDWPKQLCTEWWDNNSRIQHRGHSSTYRELPEGITKYNKPSRRLVSYLGINKLHTRVYMSIAILYRMLPLRFESCRSIGCSYRVCSPQT